ncbi:MAG: alpha/beta fold hydrolase [Pseudomonadota bacterium]
MAKRSFFVGLSAALCFSVTSFIGVPSLMGAMAQDLSEDATAAEDTTVEGVTEPGTDLDLPDLETDPILGDPRLFDKDTYTITPIVCAFKGRVDYDPEHTSCGLLTVPENREKKRPRDIRLNFVKLAAREPEDWDTEESGEWVKRDDPVIYLTGGPGAHLTGYVERLKDHGIRDTRDLFILEQRGIGYSDDFCPIYSVFDPATMNAKTPEEAAAAQLAQAEDCFRKAKDAKVDLSGYNSIENARDVKAMRQALGFEQWNVWGISYGSVLGQAYLKVDPEGIRAAVIDAIVPLEQGAHFQGVGEHYARTLNLLQEDCNADETCAKHFPDFVGRLKEAALKVSENPIELDAIDPELFPSGKAWLFEQIILGAPFIQFYEQDNYGALPAFIEGLADIVEKEDYERMRIFTAGEGGDGFVSISNGMYNAITCNDGWAYFLEDSLARDKALNPVLSLINGDPSYGAEFAKLCRKYGMRLRPAEEYLPVETNIRTLIVEGALDPITPPPLAKRILPGFSNGTYVEFDYAGHGPTRSVECAGEFLTSFFDDPEGDLDLSCPQSMEAPTFIGPVWNVDGHLNLLTTAAEDEKAVALSGAWIGASAIALILSFIVMTLSSVARVINRGDTLSTSGARTVGWLTALAGTVALGGLGYGAYASSEASDFLVLLGFVGWTKWFAALGIVAGLLGALTLFTTLRGRWQGPFPIGTLLGLLLTGFAAIGLSAWLVINGFLPI